MKNIEVSIILPTYNEKKNIIPLIERLKNVLSEVNKEIIIVDDNSPDGTSEIIKTNLKEDNEVTLIVRNNEPGLANSIREGIFFSKGRIIIVMDTDFNHNPDDVTLLYNIAKYTDMVIGSRFIFGGGMEDRFRYFLSFFFNLFVRLMIRSRIDDNLSGFFSINREKLLQLDFNKIFWGYGDYFFRLLFYAQKKKFKIVQIPTLYKLRIYGESKTNFFKTFKKYFFEIFKLWRLSWKIKKI
ncbi:MAG TPA: glycosyltransferase [bacterium]|nr:glycosyltransferase [bacterium]